MSQPVASRQHGSGLQALGLVLALAFLGCGPGVVAGKDGGGDSGTEVDDGGQPDSGDFDAGHRDAGPDDAGVPDAGRDAGPADGGSKVPVALTITPGTPTVYVGTSLQLTATLRFSDESTSNVTATATWTSSDTRLADVPLGKANAHAIGNVTITATASGQTATIPLVVAKVPLVSVTVAPASTTLALGRTQRLVATARFEDARTMDVSSTAAWESSDPAVASVAGGLVTSLSVGTSTITATLESKSGTASITVAQPVPVSLAVTPQNGSVAVGLSIPLTARATMSDSTTRDVTANAVWTSSSDAVATVAANGVVTGRAQGPAVITATLGDLSATTTIGVAPAVLVSIAITPPTPSFILGSTLPLHATGTYSDTTTADITSRVSWASDNTGIARVTQVGLLLGVSAGNANITARDTATSISATVPLTVLPATLVSIQVTAPQSSFPLGLNVQLTAKGTYSDGSEGDITSTVTWSTTAPTIAAVSAAGLVTGVAPGVAPFSAALNGKTGTISITVAQHALVSTVVLPANPQLPLGSSKDFSCLATFTDRTTSDVTANATWVAVNPTTASVTLAGRVTARSLGSGVIRATFGGIASGSTVQVVAAILDSMEVTPATVTLKPGLTQQLVARGINTDGTSQIMTNEVVWSSSDDTLATVAPGGLATAVDTGVATLTATSGGISGSMVLTVLPRLVSIAITPDAPSFPLGRGTTLKATGTFLDNHTEDLTSVALWTTEDAAIATVSPTGQVGSVAVGSSLITATVGRISGSTEVTVNEAALIGIAISPTEDSLALGLGTAFTVEGTYTDATTRDLTDTVLWTSGNDAIATVAGGIVLTHGEGTTTITASVTGGFASSATLTVTPRELVSIAVTPPLSQLPWGLKVQLTATGTYTNATTADLTSTVTWTSSLPGIASPSATGLVSTGGVGSASIIATSGTVSSSATVTVDPPNLLGISVTPTSRSAALGVDVLFTANGTYTNSTSRDLTSVVTWESSDPIGAPITASGVVSTFSQGQVTLTATTEGFTASGVLTVTPPIPTAITLSPLSPRLPLGLTVQLTAVGDYTDHVQRDVTSTVTWSSDDTATAFVSPTGLVQSAGVGIAHVTASLQGVTAQTDVTVGTEALVSMTVAPLNTDTPKGTTVVMTATGKYTNDAVRDVTQLATWSSSDDTLVTFPTPGSAKTWGVGTATLTATIGEVSAATDLTVTFQALTSIVVAPATSHIAKGTTQTLTATGHYTDGSSLDLSTVAGWDSSAPAVASVDSTGLVTSVLEGTTTVKATLGAIFGSASVTVDAHSLVSIALTPADASTPKGTPIQLKATGTFSDAVTGDVSAQATWTTSNASVTTVTGGLVQSVGEGTATITAKVNGISASTTVTVTPHALVSVLVAPSTLTKALGLSATFTATARYTDNLTADVTATADWASSNPGVATVAAGAVQTVTTGQTVLTATFDGIFGTGTLNVGPPQLLSITVAPSTQHIYKGLTAPLTATGHYTDNVDRDLTSTATWTSSASTIASVAATGVVTANLVGNATITATKDGVPGTASVTVDPAAIVSLAVTPLSPSIPLGRSVQLTATATRTDQTTGDVTTQVAWSSADPAKVTVTPSGGLAQSVAVGSSVVTATFGAINANTTVTVGIAQLVSIAVTSSAATVQPERTLQMTAIGTYTDGTTSNLTSTATWTTSNTDWATINSNGLLTSLDPGDDPGPVTVTAKGPSSTVTGSTNITVVALINVTITPASPTISLTLSLQLIATAKYSDNSTRDVTGIALWNPGATVGGLELQSTPGLVRAIGMTTGDIQAFYLTKLGTKRVAVSGASSIDLSPNPGTQLSPILLPQFRQIQYTATGHFSTPPATRDITQYATWTSTNVNNLLVENGLVTARVPSTDESITVNAGSFTRSYINVGPPVPGGPPAPSVSAMQISAPTTSLPIGLPQQLSAMRSYTNGDLQDVTDSATWTSSNPAVATVSSSGVVVGQALGTARITATLSSGISAMVTVTISPARVNSILVSAAADNPLQLVATGIFSDNSAFDFTGQAAWESSDPTVATVSASGLVSKVGAGTVTIYATAEGLSGSIDLTLQ